MKNRLISYLKNKRGGVEVVNSAIVTIIILTIFVFFIDILFFTRTYIGMSNYVDGIARTISIQGGLQSTIPTNFPGGSSLYFNKATIAKNTNDICKKYNIDSSNTTMYIQSKAYRSNSTATSQYIYVLDKNTNFRPPETNSAKTSSLKIDYGQTIMASLQYQFKWTLTGLKTNINIHRSAISSFKHADSSWEEM